MYVCMYVCMHGSIHILLSISHYVVYNECVYYTPHFAASLNLMSMFYMVGIEISKKRSKKALSLLLTEENLDSISSTVKSIVW